MKASEARKISEKVSEKRRREALRARRELEGEMEALAKRDFPNLSRALRRELKELVGAGWSDFETVIDGFEPGNGLHGNLYFGFLRDLFVKCYERDGYKVRFVIHNNGGWNRRASKYWAEVEIGW